MSEQKCRRCSGDLTHDADRDCLYCGNCHPKNKVQPAPPKEEKEYLDVKVTKKEVFEILAAHESAVEERFREIVRDELENWHIPEPSVTKDGVDAIWLTELNTGVNVNPNVATAPSTVKESDWRAQAKELGIPLFQRKKIDVLADIEAKKVAV